MIKTKEYRKTQFIAHLVCIIFTFMAVMPFILLVIASFTDDKWASMNGFSYLPKKLSLEAFRYIGMKWAIIGRAYVMTILVTLIGTSISMVISTLFAYGISKPQVKGMKTISFLLIFTMLFNGGVVSTYYCYVSIWHIKDTIAALLVPNLLMNAFNVILIRNYFVNSIPLSLEEAARIDGAGKFKIFTSIIVPLSKPILATVGLMTALAYWNDWINGLYYLTSRNGQRFFTIQIVLNNINDDIKALTQAKSSMSGMASLNIQVPSTTIRMAIAVVGILPILVIYPFFQRYFVKGITLGGVKE